NRCREPAHQFRLRDDMPTHRALQLMPRRTPRERKPRVQSVKAKEIPMFARRRLWSAVTGFAEIVQPRLHHDGSYSLTKVGRGRRNIKQQPMSKCSLRRVRIVNN